MSKLNNLTHFRPMFRFYTPGKHREIKKYGTKPNSLGLVGKRQKNTILSHASCFGFPIWVPILIFFKIEFLQFLRISMWRRVDGNFNSYPIPSFYTFWALAWSRLTRLRPAQVLPFPKNVSREGGLHNFFWVGSRVVTGKLSGKKFWKFPCGEGVW